jgi:hypothetical protein
LNKGSKKIRNISADLCPYFSAAPAVLCFSAVCPLLSSPTAEGSLSLTAWCGLVDWEWFAHRLLFVTLCGDLGDLGNQLREKGSGRVTTLGSTARHSASRSSSFVSGGYAASTAAARACLVSDDAARDFGDGVGAQTAQVSAGLLSSSITAPGLAFGGKSVEQLMSL